RAKPVSDGARWIDIAGVRVLCFGAGVSGTSPPHPASTTLGGPLPEGRGGPERRGLLPLLPSGEKVAAKRPDGGGEALHDANAAIVYFHGGGFIVGSPLTHADIATELMKHTGVPLYSVDYRLAPDHAAPAPAADGISVIRHLLSEGFSRILLCGDSAGGAIALSVEATLPDDLRRHIIGVASFYGAHGLLDTNSLIEKGSREDGTDRACVARYFLAAGGDAYSIEALARQSPVPVYLMAADDDALRDDTLILAQAMKHHERDVTLDVVIGENHGFLHHQPHYTRADAALIRFAAWVERLDRN
ncbi:MAG: alpha/beta hydrolase, partial [Rhizobium sp.]|nr:alpha/beta hydrolase [Rhizobium sp.]